MVYGVTLQTYTLSKRAHDAMVWFIERAINGSLWIDGTSFSHGWDTYRPKLNEEE